MCVCSRYYISNHGNQMPVGIKTRGIAEDGYYLATSLENAKPVSNSNCFTIHNIVGGGYLLMSGFTIKGFIQYFNFKEM